MKIEQSVRNAFAEQLAINELVKTQVEDRRRQFSEKWHFISRLKTEESFALKVEAGICDTSLVIDDFFACTLVVQNSAEIAKATAIVEDMFIVRNRRPPSHKITSMKPTEFQFNDLRIYAKLRPGYAGAAEIHNVVFEIQIKTFLQYAWGIATHDLTYKTDEVTWARHRVAAQIRAMLEHAELSIDRFDSLAESEIIAKEFKTYTRIDRIITSLRDRFDPAALPNDLQRLAGSISMAIDILDVDIDQCFAYLDKETSEGKGTKELNLSPYSAIIQSALKHHTLDLNKIENRSKEIQFFRPIMISKSVELFQDISALTPKFIKIY